MNSNTVSVRSAVRHSSIDNVPHLLFAGFRCVREIPESTLTGDASPTNSQDTDREIGQWLLGEFPKSELTLTDRMTYQAGDELPIQPFRIIRFRVREADRLTSEALTRLGELKELRGMDLQEVANEVLLAQVCRALPKLHELNLDWSNVRTGGLFPLQEMKQLRELRLTVMGIRDEDMEFLQDLKELEVLALGNTGITDAGLLHLKGLTKLNHLELNSTRITGEGFAHLPRNGKLLSLSLQSCPSLQAGSLANLHDLKSLRMLLLYQSSVTDADRAKLKEARPDIRLD